MTLEANIREASQRKRIEKRKGAKKRKRPRKRVLLDCGAPASPFNGPYYEQVAPGP